MMNVLRDKREEEEEEEEKDYKEEACEREFHMSPIFTGGDSLPLIAAALFRAHSLSQSEPWKSLLASWESRLFLILCVNSPTYLFGPMPKGQRQIKEQWEMLPTNRKNLRLFAVEYLGMGADGHAYLACTSTGRMYVLKFSQQPETAKESLQEECRIWGTVYPEFKVRLLARPALMMPHFCDPQKEDCNNSDVLAAIGAALDRFHKKGLKHCDVAWRNIGLYKKDGSLCAVVYDLAQTAAFEASEGDFCWFKKQF